MKDSVVSDNVGEISNPVDEFSSVLAGLVEQTPPLTASQTGAISTPELAKPIPSYQPYSWALLNNVLDIVDQKTNGRAGWLQRLISYLFFGGLAALVNLGTFFVMYYYILVPLHPDSLRNVISYIIAAECSIIANFVPNDRFTFNTLPGAQRPWLQRCGRFHMTTAIGSLLTFIIEFALSSLTHTQPIIAEAVATLLVLIYNFSFHHIFTYRHIKHA
jgi:putative flippase GtrA